MQWYTEGKISTSERRVLVTKWVGKAGTEVGSNDDMVARSLKNVAFLFFRRFRKWRDQQISIDGYELPTANEITEFEPDSESKIEDDESNFEVTDSCSS